MSAPLGGWSCIRAFLSIAADYPLAGVIGG
jgi:hypothetical protein